ncbi:MAG: ribonuclease HII [Chloroflexi bacterium 44-23]|nr:MAG: ribonuclease HII [Chloroflexi bacterium 44-23]
MCAARKPFEIPAAPNFAFEFELNKKVSCRVAGLDEAGRGAWAGPVSAAVVILPLNSNICELLSGVRDSKQISASKRNYWAEKIKEIALAWAIGFSTQEEIDATGIIAATRCAMTRALTKAANSSDHLLIDALLLPQVDNPQTALIKGDQRSLSIAAASILAKTARDHWMQETDQLYPQYGFSSHKGYGTGRHQQALAKFGPCPLHRMSFKPLIALSQRSNIHFF